MSQKKGTVIGKVNVIGYQCVKENVEYVIAQEGTEQSVNIQVWESKNTSAQLAKFVRLLSEKTPNNQFNGNASDCCKW